MRVSLAHAAPPKRGCARHRWFRPGQQVFASSLPLSLTGEVDGLSLRRSRGPAHPPRLLGDLARRLGERPESVDQLAASLVVELGDDLADVIASAPCLRTNERTTLGTQRDGDLASTFG